MNNFFLAIFFMFCVSATSDVAAGMIDNKFSLKGKVRNFNEETVEIENENGINIVPRSLLNKDWQPVFGERLVLKLLINQVASIKLKQKKLAHEKK